MGEKGRRRGVGGKGGIEDYILPRTGAQSDRLH